MRLYIEAKAGPVAIVDSQATGDAYDGLYE